ncbi:MAG: hypothetical protein WBG62_05320, partial [Cyclobacteriaceae bacterium]
MKEIVVHCMEESEVKLAEKLLEASQSADSLVTGTATEENIQIMRDEGLIIQEIEDQTLEEPRPLWREDIQAASANVDFSGLGGSEGFVFIESDDPGQDDFTSIDFDLFIDSHYILQLKG